MKVDLGELGAYLFSYLDKIDNLDLDKIDMKELEKEIERSKMYVNVSQTILDAGDLALRSAQFRDDRMDIDQEYPQILENGDELIKYRRR